MKLINYDKYNKKWTPRRVVLLLLMEAVSTGFFLGAALIVAIYSHGHKNWIWPLVMAFASGVVMLQAALLALHNCPASTRAQRTEATPHDIAVK